MMALHAFTRVAFVTECKGYPTAGRIRRKFEALHEGELSAKCVHELVPRIAVILLNMV